MLLYLNDAERSRLLQPYITACERDDGFLSILSGEPGKEKRKLSSSAETLVQDARVFVKTGSDPLQSYIELLDEAREQFVLEGFDEWLWIADWAHLAYESFDIVMKDERYRAEHLDATAVCCYRNGGFSSLLLRDIVELIEMHDVVIFPATTFIK